MRTSVRNGIDIIRIFDALNDIDNLRVAIEATVEAGAMASGTISYTTSPVHTLDSYVKLAKEMAQMGIGSICIKDMAGILTPKAAYDLVAALKDAVDLPVVMHTHSTTGMAFMAYLKGIEAGADVIDTAISPFSGGTSQPATGTLYCALKELGYGVDLNEKLLYEIADYFKPIRAEYIADGTLNPISMGTDTQCLNYQIPGGMLSNLLSQLKMMNALDKFNEALLETPRVRKDMGYPPLVTPTSQLIGTQAVQNVLAGERYKNVGAEMRAYCRGEYGRTPAPIDPEIRAKILGGEKPVEGRYAATLPADTYEKAEKALGDTAALRGGCAELHRVPAGRGGLLCQAPRARGARRQLFHNGAVRRRSHDRYGQHFRRECRNNRYPWISRRVRRADPADAGRHADGQDHGCAE